MDHRVRSPMYRSGYRIGSLIGFWGFFATLLVVGLAALGTVIWIAAHFLAKVW